MPPQPQLVTPPPHDPNVNDLAVVTIVLVLLTMLAMVTAALVSPATLTVVTVALPALTYSSKNDMRLRLPNWTVGQGVGARR